MSTTSQTKLGRLIYWFLNTRLGRKLFAKYVGNFGN